LKAADRWSLMQLLLLWLGSVHVKAHPI